MKLHQAKRLPGNTTSAPRELPSHDAVKAERTRERDLVLLGALESGKPGAWAELWAGYGDVAYRAAMLLTGDTMRASDAVVAGFVALARCPESARLEPLPQSLIATIRQQCAGQEAENDGQAIRMRLSAMTDQQLTIVAMVTSGRFHAGDAARLLDVALPTVHALLREVLATVAVQSRDQRVALG